MPMLLAYHILSEVARCRLTLLFRVSHHASFQLLKLKYDKLLSKFAFSCNLRHYTEMETISGGSILLVGLGRKCSKYPLTHDKPSFLELNTIL